MKLSSLFIFTAALSIGMISTPKAQAKDKWVCMKEGTEQKVKGKSPKDKEKDCTAKGGVWEKAQADDHDKHSSGSGGAW